ncbi:MAG: prolyl oligopeptidase family serine peptidase [Bacteroidota bacterium]
MKYNILLASALLWTFCASAQLKYPPTRKTDTVDTYFGTKVPDPYRWLEDDRSEETAAWVATQNEITRNYMSHIPMRNEIKNRLNELWNYPKSSVPFKGGNHYFVQMNDGMQNQYVLNIIRDMRGKPAPFLDPNTLSSDGTVNLGTVSVSKDGKNLAYEISRAGSDWSEIYVMNIDNGKQWHDKLQWVKFSGISWRAKGFYYSRYDAPDSASVLKGANQFHKVYFHQVGNEQKYDILIYTDKDHPQRNFAAGVTEDERYLILSGSEGTSGNNMMVQDLRKGDGKWITVVDNFDNQYEVVDNDSNIFYIKTNKDASNYKLVAIDINKPGTIPRVVIPEGLTVMQHIISASYNFVGQYMENATSQLKVFNRKGGFEYDIKLEGMGTVEELSGDNKDQNLFYSLTTFTSPPVVYQYSMRMREQEVYFKPQIKFNSDDYVTEQKFYQSKDGTKIPMFIVHRKDMKLDGSNPTLLFGYGGFNISKTPDFRLDRLVLLEHGGIFAMPSLRGGGEFGEKWHEAGTKEKKQNVFDDFISAAQYLIDNKYTSPAKLGIGGRSNGGLLVGAVMLQRPDLFKVALPNVGVLDMLRYHKFTIGWAWKGDYGSSETKEGFDYLYKYSPLHNIKEGVAYPATLVTTGDHDDRVVPAHSFKFISTLQEKYKGDNPMLIRVDVNAGHAASTPLGSSKPVVKQIEELTDVFSFLLYNLGAK